MALIQPTGTMLPAEDAKPPRGWRYGHSLGRNTLAPWPGLTFARTLHARRLLRNQFLKGLTTYWLSGAPLTPAIYANFVTTFSPWTNWDGKQLFFGTFEAFMAMNAIGFANYLGGTYDPFTDTPFSENYGPAFSPRANWSNPRIVTIGLETYFELDTADVPTNGGVDAIAYSPMRGRLLPPSTVQPYPVFFKGIATSSQPTPGTVRFRITNLFFNDPTGKPLGPTTIYIRPAAPPTLISSPPPTYEYAPPVDQLLSAIWAP